MFSWLLRGVYGGIAEAVASVISVVDVLRRKASACCLASCNKEVWLIVLCASKNSVGIVTTISELQCKQNSLSCW